MKHHIPPSPRIGRRSGIAQQPPPIAPVAAGPTCLRAQQFAKQQPPPAQLPPAQQTVVEEIIVRVNNSIITRADLQRSKEALAGRPRQGRYRIRRTSPRNRTCCAT